MKERPTISEVLQDRGISRRSFLKFCAATATTLALSGKQGKMFAEALAASPRPSVIWMSFQQCTGCSESLLRSYDPTVENLILDIISLDYHESLQVAAGHEAEKSRRDAMAANFGKYILVVDGAVPTGSYEWWMAVAGQSALASLKEAVAGAELVVALGTCATFGGLPAAFPNPTAAKGVRDLMVAGLIPTKALVNVSGCPPVPEVIGGTIAAYLAVKANPALPPLQFDSLNRPLAFYGKTVHANCSRQGTFLDTNRMPSSHGDPNARQGGCLAALGCRGPETYNYCSIKKWNQESYPMMSGHGCIGCSEPGFWDRGSNGDGTFSGGFYS